MAQPAKAPQQRTLNGVDLDRLVGTIEAIKDKPSLANFQFRARSQWIEGGRSRTTITDFDGAGERHRHAKPFILESDEPPVLLGSDRAPNPVLFLLHGLASCLATSIAYHAAANGIRVKEIESQIEGDIDLHGFLGLNENARKGYKQIRVKLRVKADCPDDKLKEVFQLGQKFSPVYDALANAVPIQVEMAQ
jgi:uncharacterized OsmC-like protein